VGRRNIGGAYFQFLILILLLLLCLTLVLLRLLRLQQVLTPVIASTLL
jgi:hypothetical protein